MSGGTYGLDNRKYELKRDVKGVQIGDYTNVILPKGTIIYNVPGGVFAHQDVLAAYQSGQNKYFNKPKFKGISIKRTKNTIMAIEKNSTVLEGKSAPYGSGYKKAPLLPTTTDHAEVSESGEDINNAVIPGGVRIKLQKALDIVKGTKLSYQQKLQVVGRVLDSLSIDKKELNKISSKLRTKLESVNEANSRDEYDAKEFWGVSKIGIQLHKQFKGRFNKSKFEKAFSDLIGKSKRPESTIKIIGRYLNIKPSKLNSYTSGEIIEDQEFIKDSTKKAEQLYKIFVSSNESVNEGKYNYKADALTAYFKGKIDAKELDKIARDDFKSGIATKKELSNFLSNKFTQDVMSDTYGIPAGTLIKRVRGLMKFAEGVSEGKDDFMARHGKADINLKKGYKHHNEDELTKLYDKVGKLTKNKKIKKVDVVFEDKSEIKGLVKKVGNKETKFYDVLSAMEKKYGKQKYRIWLEKSLKAFGVNSKHYDYRTNAGAEEKLFQLGK